MQKKKRNEAKDMELREAIKELDRLNIREYTEIQGGKVVNQQLQGGTLRPVKGGPSWHERDTLVIMHLRHRYQKDGMWRGEMDRAQFSPVHDESVTLTRTLSADDLHDLANFIEAMFGRPALVEAIRSQESRALCGDVSVIYGRGITAAYDVVAEVAEHRDGFTYFYFDEQGTLRPHPAPGKTLPEWPIKAEEEKVTAGEHEQSAQS